jgi:hypothetical protein
MSQSKDNLATFLPSAPKEMPVRVLFNFPTKERQTENSNNMNKV